jgi:hypothetical protein
MTDELGLGKAHGVVHRKTSRVKTLIDIDYWPKQSIPYGTFQFGGSHAIQMRYYSNSFAESFFSFNVDSNGDQLPTGWTITYPTVTDSVVVNDLKTKASELKADAVLNIVEANSTWQSLKQLAQCIPKMKENWKRLTKRNLLVTASSNYLAWKFGVSPIISDLTNIARFAPRMEKDYEKFVSGGRSRYSALYEGTASFYRPDTVAVINGVAVYTHKYSGFQYTIPPQLRYVLVTRPVNNVYLTDTFRKLSYIMTRFSSSPANLIWERIPFSFIADWFVDVRGSLDKIDGLLGHEPFKVLSLTRSKAYKFQNSMHFTQRNICTGTVQWSGLQAQSIDEHYERSVLSQGPKISWRPRFGKSQAGISAALIAQRLAASNR